MITQAAHGEAKLAGCCVLLFVALMGCRKAELSAAPNAEKAKLAESTAEPAEPTAKSHVASPSKSTPVIQAKQKQHKKMSRCADKFYPQLEDDSIIAKILAALARPTTIDYSKVPLREVVDDLKNQHNIEIQLDNKALDEAGIETDVPITRRLKTVSLRSALKLMLRDMDLAFIIKDEVLLITAPEVAENHLVTRMYDVGELASTGLDDTQHPDITAVIQLIQSVVAPTSWESVGGPGSIPSYDGILIINQDQYAQATISRLLTQLCRLKNGDIKPTSRSIPVTEVSADLPEDAPSAAKGVAAIHSALRDDAEFDFTETPLGQAIAELAKVHDINIAIDHKACDEARIETSTPITRRLSGITLRSALALMLRDMDLTHIVKDEVLLITTPEVAENHLVIRLYPVGDLARTVELTLTRKLLQVSDKPQPDYETLRHMIYSSVTPTWWGHVGGPDTIGVFEPAECLVIVATQETHTQVDDLLAQLRDVLKRRPRPPPEIAPPISPDRVMTLVYSLRSPRPDASKKIDDGVGLKKLPDSSGSRFVFNPSRSLRIATDDLAKKIQEYVEPESWSSDDFGIDVFGEGLLIRQTYATHCKIAKLLDRLDQLSTHQQGWEFAIRNVADPASPETQR